MRRRHEAVHCSVHLNDRQQSLGIAGLATLIGAQPVRSVRSPFASCVRNDRKSTRPQQTQMHMYRKVQEHFIINKE